MPAQPLMKLPGPFTPQLPLPLAHHKLSASLTGLRHALPVRTGAESAGSLRVLSQVLQAQNRLLQGL